MQKQINEKSFEGQTIYAGMDVHLKNWKVTILCGDMEHKQFNQDPSAEILANYLKRNFPGASYKAVYEAGFCGFGACRKLRELGVDCMVIHPADVPTTQSERFQKTDAVDSRKLAKSLRAKDFKCIDIPEVKLEIDRALIRQRVKLVKEIARYKNRVKSLLMQLGISIPESFKSQSRHWSSPFIKWLQTIEHSEELFEQVINNYIKVGKHLRAELLSISKQIKELSKAERYTKKFELINSIPGFGNSAGMYFWYNLEILNDLKQMMS